MMVFCFSFSKGQQISLSDTTVDDTKVLLRKERTGFLMIHTSGFGIGYRSGKHITGYKKRMFEIELTGMKHPKEIRTVNPYFENSKSYIYGKENSFLLIRAGLGKQKIINSKPYWGGVELRYFYYGGLSLGLLKPVYLYILHKTSVDYEYNLSIEKYDPDTHFAEDIFGRAPFLQGFNKLKPMPGLYFKTGLNFEYGAYDESVKAIEAGVTLDAYTKNVPIMAFVKNRNYFISLYLSFHFGSRGN
jgi:hypothetical protein